MLDSLKETLSIKFFDIARKSYIKENDLRMISRDDQRKALSSCLYEEWNCLSDELKIVRIVNGNIHALNNFTNNFAHYKYYVALKFEENAIWKITILRCVCMGRFDLCILDLGAETPVNI